MNGENKKGRSLDRVSMTGAGRRTPQSELANLPRASGMEKQKPEKASEWMYVPSGFAGTNFSDGGYNNSSGGKMHFLLS